MKIRVMSDLHLEMDGNTNINPGQGDILILAGDILSAKHLQSDGKLGNKYKQFLTNCSENYNRVLYVAGNHEHYSYHLTSTIEDIRKHLPNNITLLENDTVRIDDWVFIGMTMWTDFNRKNPSDMFVIKQMMNDYHCIRFGDKYRKLLPEDTYQIHIESKQYLLDELQKYENDNVFVITHHAPCHLSIHERYVGNVSNFAYYSDLTDVILNHQNIRYWVHGHTHNKVDYTVGNCRIICNPRGYVEFDPEGTGFSEQFAIDI